MEEIAHDPTLVSTKVSALEVLNILLKSSCNLNEKIQFESIVSAIGSVLERHSS